MAQTMAGIRYVEPEARRLRLDELCDLEDFARAAGVSRQTLHTYRHGSKTNYRFPEPVAHVGITPVWTKEQAREWIRTRPGQGARIDLYSQGRAVPDEGFLDDEAHRLVGGTD